MKKLIILFILISTFVIAKPRVSIYTDVEFQKEQDEIMDMYLEYPINKEETLQDVLAFFYDKSTSVSQWIVHDKKTGNMIISLQFTRTVNGEILSTAQISLVYPFNSKYKDLDNIVKTAKFKGTFSMEDDFVNYEDKVLKKQLTKMLSNTDEDIYIPKRQK